MDVKRCVLLRLTILGDRCIRGERFIPRGNHDRKNVIHFHFIAELACGALNAAKT